ncbi:SLC13 family permease [Aporhodopirellula aestuarii]|uniref:SLC13 family permease n=1 Tax=Aporhodopirellula aestuarii TaxID=2950107 RepID=A0ABT0U007_9BACT|nr:SLC13 family permease [Aporhodopirellula aestuarii]MCM2370167.1 SLC13 family permease [Aporhodopirellula aestuarii]
MFSEFRALSITIGIALALFMYGVCLFGFSLAHEASVTAAVICLCGVWWCTEAVPIPVTSLVPFVLFPFTGVLDHTQLAGAYGDKFVLLFLAGFMISRAAEKSSTHLRVSHGMMRILGTHSQRRIVLGFMLAPAFCSMWISNTATALIMLPVAIALLQEKSDSKLHVPLLLAVAYGSSIGGMATIIGTPPNGVFVSIYELQTSQTVDFLSWLKIGVPITAAMLVVTGYWLTRGLGGSADFQIQSLGPWTPAQRRVLAIIGATAFLWITRTGPFGGWSSWLNVPMVHDATVGLGAVVMMFLIPSGEVDEKGHGETLLDWAAARDIPWGILILFGGGLAIARAAELSGLSERIGLQLTLLNSLHPVLLIGIVCLTVTFLTEFTSNTATTTLLMPILGAASAGAGYDAAILMIPAALSASCAFMLPVATPPNAIIFGSEKITVREMARTGFVLNLAGAVLITAICYFILDLKTGLL